MNFILYLFPAAAIGWVATKLLQDHNHLRSNIITTFIGGFLGGFVLSRFFGVGTIIDPISIPTMFVTLLGSLILLSLVYLVRPRIDIRQNN